MSALVVDGKALAKEIESAVHEEVQSLIGPLSRKPGLAVVLVGDDPASHVYVRNKTRKAERCGIEVTDVKLSADISSAELKERICRLGAGSEIDGILLQLPLPKGLDEYGALLSIPPFLDVDGLHPQNQGNLLRGAECPLPCTPAGCIALIDRARRELGMSADLSGLKAVVIGRSILVGKPVALMLLARHCTVTLCHSRTASLREEISRADIVIAAVGQPRIIKGDYIKPGAIVIDVGINRGETGELVGDVDFESAKEVAAAITPVPGGVGPMTIAMLLKNTVRAARRRIGTGG